METWQEVSISLHREAQEAAVEILMNNGAKGVEIDDPRTPSQAEEGIWGDYIPLPERKGESLDSLVLKVYFPEHKGEQELEEIRQQICSLSQYGLETGDVRLITKYIKEEDWANAWKQYYHKVNVGAITIEPSWEDYPRPEGQIVIKLDPGMAFGTGNHPTTASCLAMLQDVNLENKRVWDVGTGSGVLAIAAIKLGAKQVHAVDVDPVAVEVALDNAQQNKVQFSIQRGSLDILPGSADLIIANIIADVILDLLPEIPSRLTSGGLFLASGIIDSKAEQVLKSASRLGLALIERRDEGEWRSFLFQWKGN